MWSLIVLASSTSSGALPRVADPTAIYVAALTAISAIVVALVANRRPRAAPPVPPDPDALDPPALTRLDLVEHHQATQHSEIQDVVADLRHLTERFERHVDGRGRQ